MVLAGGEAHEATKTNTPRRQISAAVSLIFINESRSGYTPCKRKSIVEIGEIAKVRAGHTLALPSVVRHLIERRFAQILWDRAGF